MEANEIFGIFLAVLFGAAALTPAVIRLVTNPRAWEMWVVLGAGVALLLGFIIAYAADWGGCDAPPDSASLSCVDKHDDENLCHVCEWNPRCRKADVPCIKEGDACNDDDVAAAKKASTTGKKQGKDTMTTVPRGRMCDSSQRPHFEYCETFADGKVKQPVNTWSALGFAAAGFWVIFMLRVGPSAPEIQPMRTPTFFSVAYGVALVFLWWGTVLQHASFREWGGFLDSFSIAVWLLFTIVYSGGRQLGWFVKPSVLWILVFCGIFGTLAMGVAMVDIAAPGARLVFHIVFGAILLGFEAVVLIYQAAAKKDLGKAHRNHFWYWFIVGSFAVAFVAKVLCDFTEPTPVWCTPDSPMQGHALWHIAVSATCFFAFMYYREETLNQVPNDE